MAIPDPKPEEPGGGEGGGGTTPPGGGTQPPPATGAKLSAYTTNTNIVFTADQVSAAGGPWNSYTIRVTPINANGNGPYVEFTYPPPSPSP